MDLLMLVKLHTAHSPRFFVDIMILFSSSNAAFNETHTLMLALSPTEKKPRIVRAQKEGKPRQEIEHDEYQDGNGHFPPLVCTTLRPAHRKGWI